MTNEELDRARAEEAQRLFLDGSDESLPILIAARLAREGWTPPMAVDPDLLEARIIQGDKFFDRPTIQNAILAGAHDTHPEMVRTLQAIKRGRGLERAEAKPKRSKEHSYPSPEDVKQIITDWENDNSEDPGNLNCLVAQAILHGRALAAEAKPRLVWVKHDGGKSPIADRDTQVAVIYDDGTLIAGDAHERDWSIVVLYAEITPPEDVA